MTREKNISLKKANDMADREAYRFKPLEPSGDSAGEKRGYAQKRDGRMTKQKKLFLEIWA